MKILPVILLVIVFFNNSFSCDCEEAVGYKKADEVFIGRVTKMEFLEETYEVKVTLTVENAFKGKLHEKRTIREIEVYSSLNVCGYHWDISGFYLVFIENVDNTRIVNMCSMTTKINYEFDPNGNWIGIPTLEEVKAWGFNNAIRRKYAMR